MSVKANQIIVLSIHESWAVECQQDQKVSIAEMRMLRGMSGRKIINKSIREKVRAAPIEENMTEKLV